MVAMAGEVNDRRATAGLELPPADQVRIGNGNIRQGRETPNVAFVGHDPVELINPPVVRGP